MGGNSQQGEHKSPCRPPPSGILSLRLQGDTDKGLCGLEKYQVTHPWAGLGPSAQPPAARLSFFNAFNSFRW